MTAIDRRPEVILVAALFFIAAEFFILGPFSVVIAGDNGELLIPQLLSMMHADAIPPLWDNFSAAGSDKATEGYITWIDSWAFTMLPGWLALALRVGSQIVLAGWGVYWLCRHTLGLAPAAAIVGGIAYALQFNHAMLLHSTLSCQLVALVALTLVLRDRRDWRRWLALAGALFLLAHTAYFSRLFPFPAAVMVAWFLFVDRTSRWGDWLIVVGAGIASMALRAGDLIALMSIVPLSHAPLVRPQPSIADALRDFVTAPFFLTTAINLMCTALFAAGLVHAGLRNAREKGLLALLALGTVAPLAALAALEALVLLVPMAKGYSVMRFQYLASTTLAFAGAMGCDALLGGGRLAPLARRALLTAAGALLLYSAGAAKLVSVKDWLSQGSYFQAYDSPLLHDFAARLAAEPMPVRAEPFQMYPNLLQGYGIETAGGYQPLFLLRYYEFWGRMLEPWLLGINPDKFEDWGEHAKKFAAQAGPGAFRGDRLMLSPPDHKTDWAVAELYHLPMLSLANVGYLLSRDRLLDPSLELVREASAPWSSLSTMDKIRVNALGNFRGRDNLYIYRNTQVMPRVFSPPGLRLFDNSDQMLAALAAGSVAEFRASAFLLKSELPAGFDPKAPLVPLEVALEHYGSDRITLKVAGEGAGLIVVGNAFSPHWRASVDGVETRIIPAYHAFWGLPVGPGRHRIEFWYAPPFASARSP